MSVTAAEIVTRFGVSMDGAPSAHATSIDALSHVGSKSLAWFGHTLAPQGCFHWQGAILITGLATNVAFRASSAVIRTDNPRLLFIQVVRAFFAELVDAPPRLDISPRASIHASAVIGTDGQGYEWDEQRQIYQAVPHLAGVIIEDDVVIGPCSTIMRGVLQDTHIEAGTKIGNGVNIGHGVHIGRHCVITAHASIAGSARIGDRVTIWQGALIGNRVTIGDGALIGMGAVVRHNVDPNTIVVGNPAKEIQ